VAASGAAKVGGATALPVEGRRLGRTARRLTDSTGTAASNTELVGMMPLWHERDGSATSGSQSGRGAWRLSR
jgi:hypothetical protein